MFNRKKIKALELQRLIDSQSILKRDELIKQKNREINELTRKILDLEKQGKSETELRRCLEIELSAKNDNANLLRLKTDECKDLNVNLHDAREWKQRAINMMSEASNLIRSGKFKSAQKCIDNFKFK